jgi:YidC/Oxa1 family membrane protein insertase
MDRNQAIGLVLISALLLIYTLFFVEKQDPIIADGPPAVSQVAPANDPAPALPDSVLAEQRAAALGRFSTAATGEAREVVLENQDVQVTLSTEGGQVERVRLKNYQTWDHQPLILFDPESSDTDISFQTTDGKTVRLSDLHFEPSAVTATTLADKPAQAVSFRAQIGEGQFIEQNYLLPENSFQVQYQLNFRGLDQVVAPQPLTFSWVEKVRRLERDPDQVRKHSTINYLTADESFDYLSISNDPETETLTEPLKWVTNKQNFFSSGIIAATPFQGGIISSTTDLADTTYLKTLASELRIPVSAVTAGAADFTYYFGPNDYTILKEVAEEFTRNVDLGWGIFAWVNRLLIIPAFDFLENYIGNYGIIIILLVLYIKTLLFPLTYKSYISMAKMKVLKPEIDAIKEKNEGDMQKTQAETMKLYSTMGVNPMSGCIPMLLQIPILFAMFNFFPNSIELRQESFLWAEDLSTYDVFARLPFEIPFYGSHVSMFTLLMTLSTILYTWSNNQVSTIQGPMKFYTYMMPVIFMFVLNSFPAGLSFYYFVSNIVTFGQQAIIRRFVDEKKIRARLEENKIKNKDKKTSSFQQRLQDAMKAAAEKDAQRKAKK